MRTGELRPGEGAGKSTPDSERQGTWGSPKNCTFATHSQRLRMFTKRLWLPLATAARWQEWGRGGAVITRVNQTLDSTQGANREKPRKGTSRLFWAYYPCAFFYVAGLQNCRDSEHFAFCPAACAAGLLTHFANEALQPPGRWKGGFNYYSLLKSYIGRWLDTCEADGAHRVWCQA